MCGKVLPGGRRLGQGRCVVKGVLCRLYLDIKPRIFVRACKAVLESRSDILSTVELIHPFQ